LRKARGSPKDNAFEQGLVVAGRMARQVDPRLGGRRWRGLLFRRSRVPKANPSGNVRPGENHARGPAVTPRRVRVDEIA
jgi:hypothetical protein